MTALCAGLEQSWIGGTVQDCVPMAGNVAVLAVAALELLTTSEKNHDHHRQAARRLSG